MPVESVNIKAVKAKREAAELAQKKVQKVEDSRDMKMKIKATKRPMNPNTASCAAVSLYEPCEYKTALPLMLVEAIARGLPQVVPADPDRLKERLLRSQDVNYLLNKTMMNYSIESDKTKLILTLAVHCVNEVVTSITETKKIEELHTPKASSMPEQPKKEEQKPIVFEAQESIDVKTTR